MAAEEHYIDPEPDMVLVMQFPCVDFAPWPKNEEEDDWWGFAKMISTKKKKKKKGKKIQKQPEDGLLRSSISMGNHDAANIFEESTTVPSSSSQATIPTDSITDASTDVEVNDAEGSIRYYVSSRHLILGSSYFRRALSDGKWAESEREKQDKLFHIRAKDSRSDVFLILLNIFHLQNRKVPRKISLDNLAEIAVLVDYYECAEAIEVFSNIWIEDLKVTAPIPHTYCRDLILWICVSRVFGLADQFKNATRVAITQCSGPMNNLDLPLSNVPEKVDLKRYESIEHIIAGLHSLRQTYKSRDYSCPENTSDSFVCGSIFYGAITKELLRLRLAAPRPEIPFVGLTFDMLSSNIQKIENPRWRSSFSDSYGYHSCNLKTAVTAIVDNVASTITGLHLE